MALKSPPSAGRAQSRPPADYKALYRKLERTINGIERTDDQALALSGCLKSLVDSFDEDLGFVGGRLYERDEDSYVLVKRYGRCGKIPIGYRVPIGYQPIQTLLRAGIIIMRRTDPGYDEVIEGAIGHSKFAAFAVGENNRYILSLTIRGPIDEEHTLYALNGVRHIINLKMREQRLHDIFHEAREIQLSILPAESPSFSGYDLHGESRPADLVGGDVFDYILMSERLMGVAIADASGHGLPAALQARDVITGIRMGMEENLKIITAIERLNRVINRSSLSSRFVSMFYAEVESNGNFIYCNAGHPPALLLSGGKYSEMSLGGPILGPNPTARYERGFARLNPGDCILMYTDGVTEAEGPREKFYGLNRLRAALKRCAGQSARAVVEALFADLDTYTAGRPQEDDRTLVVLRRT